MKTNARWGRRHDTIRDKAAEIVQRHPGGVRFGDLVAEVKRALSGFNMHTIMTQVSGVHLTRARLVRKPARGIFRPARRG